MKNDFAEFQIAESLIEEIESLICETQLRSEKKTGSLDNMPATRDELFEKKSYEDSKLPPTRGALQVHLKRAFHQILIFIYVV